MAISLGLKKMYMLTALGIGSGALSIFYYIKQTNAVSLEFFSEQLYKNPESATEILYQCIEQSACNLMPSLPSLDHTINEEIVQKKNLQMEKILNAFYELRANPFKEIDGKSAFELAVENNLCAKAIYKRDVSEIEEIEGLEQVIPTPTKAVAVSTSTTGATTNATTTGAPSTTSATTGETMGTTGTTSTTGATTGTTSTTSTTGATTGTTGTTTAFSSVTNEAGKVSCIELLAESLMSWGHHPLHSPEPAPEHHF